MARNNTISYYVGRLARSKLFSKKGGYKQTDRKPAAKSNDEAASVKEKTVGGAKNSGKRSVPTKKAQRFYPADDVRSKKVSRKTAKPTKLRESITPGTVLILLAGRFRGKRVVFLKQLDSGLLLVTGPFKLNGVPLRRVNQAYVIATSTKVDLSSVQLDPKLNDAYFRREKSSKTKAENSFFADPANKAPIAENRVADQKAIDKEVVAAVKKQGPILAKYLAATFSLSKGDKPHALRF
ncbi:60S ribosomal protein L6 [Malassezia psittaci]|uniref:60S ribosomal protein L6 n=1 Tax=Malassezia psittaci TaxID=1821823 RepID=A0AAF0FEI4_9BASI|nr:60S ribosomal protein L6 [Malassezia psittaci]